MNDSDLDDLYEYEDELDEDDEDIMCIDGKHYLATLFNPYNGRFLIHYRVNRSILFQFEYPRVLRYVQQPANRRDRLFGKIEIVQVVMEKGRDFAIIKTGWIRIFQRVWRRFYKEKQKWLAHVKKNIISFMTSMHRIPCEPPFRGCFWDTLSPLIYQKSINIKTD